MPVIGKAQQLEWIHKVYAWPDLLDGRQTVLQRCHLVERLSREFEALAETCFEIGDAAVVYRQEKVQCAAWDSLEESKQHRALSQWAEEISQVTDLGFVHGDVHKRNLVFDGERLVLVDFEPSFRQIRFGRRVVLCAVPRYSTADRARGRPSVETDKIGFYLTVLELIGAQIPSWTHAESNSVRIDKVLPVSEQALVEMDFCEILDQALRYAHSA